MCRGKGWSLLRACRVAAAEAALWLCAARIVLLDAGAGGGHFGLSLFGVLQLALARAPVPARRPPLRLYLFQRQRLCQCCLLGAAADSFANAAGRTRASARASAGGRPCASAPGWFVAVGELAGNRLRMGRAFRPSA